MPPKPICRGSSARLQGRRLRADRGSGRGEEARRQIGRPRARSSALVTPGTLTEDALLDARRHNYLAALARGRGADRRSPGSTSRPATSRPAVEPARGLAAALARIAPGEILVPERLAEEPARSSASRLDGGADARCPPSRFDSQRAERLLKAALRCRGARRLRHVRPAPSLPPPARSWTTSSDPERPACRACSRRASTGLDETMAIDAATRRSLELTQTLSGDAARLAARASSTAP